MANHVTSHGGVPYKLSKSRSEEQAYNEAKAATLAQAKGNSYVFGLGTDGVQNNLAVAHQVDDAIGADQQIKMTRSPQYGDVSKKKLESQVLGNFEQPDEPGNAVSNRPSQVVNTTGTLDFGTQPGNNPNEDSEVYQMAAMDSPSLSRLERYTLAGDRSGNFANLNKLSDIYKLG